MRRIWVLLLLLVLLWVPVSAFTMPEDLAGADIEAIVADYMEENYLNEHTFSYAYYNTVTGETFSYNEDYFMVAASTYKLPLNMYYYEMERDGLIESDAFIPRAGTTLDVAHRESLVHSNNDLSIGLLYNLGDFRTYKTLMKEAYFTMDENTIDPIYYADNHYCVHMMMDALKYLYAHSEDFSEMLDYMKQAQPGEYFKAGVTEYEVAHKYGWYEGAVNDVGIIYTEEPFLLAVYTQDVYGEHVTADLAALFTAYNTANTTPAEPEPETEPAEPEELEGAVTLEIEMVAPDVTEEAPEEVPEKAPPAEEPEPAPEMTVETVGATEEPEKTFEWWMVAVALGVFVLGGGGTLLVFNNKHLKKMKLDEDEEAE